MKIVIDVPDNYYNDLMTLEVGENESLSYEMEMIRNGTPLEEELEKIKNEIQGLIDFEESCCGDTTLGYQCLGVIEDILREQTSWISVSEWLPDIDEKVLVDDGLDMFVAWWVDDGLEAGWHSFDESYNPDRPILAWMPLPTSYKESEK